MGAWWYKGVGRGRGDSEVIDPEGSSDHNREVAHLCIVGKDLEITCERRRKLDDMSNRKATWWECCLIRAAGQVEDNGLSAGNIERPELGKIEAHGQ